MTSEFTPDHGARFAISGQFAHFRDIFTQAFFETLLGPPRPTILGMIGAALGMSERDVVELGKRLLVGFRIVEIRGFANEITTALNLKSPPTRTPVLRSILVEPSYEICIASDDVGLLSRILQSLREPIYPLYLGISDFLAQVTKVDDVVSSLTRRTSKVLECVAPVTGEDKHIVKLQEPLSGFYVPPRKYHTVHSFKLTPKGRQPNSHIDLLMFFKCDIEFTQEKRVYEFEDGARFCIF
jgi:CRISPR-associated protein Cas5 subtype I-B